MALIELDLTAQPGHPAPTAIPPARRYRTPGLLLAVALALVLGGAAALGPPSWSYLGALPAAPVPESPFQLDGDQLFTVGGAGTSRTVTAWTLAEPPVKRWSVPFPPQNPGPDEVPFGNVQARLASPVMLLTEGPRTVALDARTGATRWRSGVPVRALPGGRIGLAEEPRFRPGTEFDQNSVAPGELYFSATGVPHREPPIGTDLRGVDLRTGATVWSATAAGAIAAYGDAGGLLVLESNRLTQRAIDTGAVLHTTALPRLDGQSPDSGRLAGELMLISYGAGDSTERQLVAYSLRTFRPLWQTPEAQVLTRSGLCLDLVCADDKSGVSVLDPATGRARWHATDLDLTRYGTGVLEKATGTGAAVRLVDARTGAERLSLAGWYTGLNPAADAPAVVWHGNAAGGSVFALAHDNPPVLKPLGASRGPVSDCAVNARFVVCRGTGVLQVYEFHG